MRGLWCILTAESSLYRFHWREVVPQCYPWLGWRPAALCWNHLMPPLPSYAARVAELPLFPGFPKRSHLLSAGCVPWLSGGSDVLGGDSPCWHSRDSCPAVLGTGRCPKHLGFRMCSGSAELQSSEEALKLILKCWIYSADQESGQILW